MSFEPWAWESENWGGDPEGPLAKALERARSQKPKPLKLIKLPHKDQTSLTEFKEKGIKLKKILVAVVQLKKTLVNVCIMEINVMQIILCVLAINHKKILKDI